MQTSWEVMYPHLTHFLWAGIRAAAAPRNRMRAAAPMLRKMASGSAASRSLTNSRAKPRYASGE